MMWEMLDAAVPYLPGDKPRHLLGVGSPDDLLEGIARGVDMFDCVLPTRTARTGGLYTPSGRHNIRAARFREEAGPVDSTCDCYTCRTFSAAYLHHLIRSEEDESRGELLYYRLASIHNLRFLLRLVEGAQRGNSRRYIRRLSCPLPGDVRTAGSGDCRRAAPEARRAPGVTITRKREINALCLCSECEYGGNTRGAGSGRRDDDVALHRSAG